MSEKIYTIEEIKKILSEILKDKPVYQVILFGSYAKKNATKDSDIDLIIDTKSKLKGFALLKLICQIEEKLQKEIDGFEKYEIVENSLIDKEIRKTGVIVYEK
ncbi:MAG: nucleotidyltransferase domain-containing protein [Clostridia bacterium]|jgi:predicted nucleotidyltransferase|nr:nucleotidyltransferase domain-containing protein [Clostridia bacterium]CDE84034.1 nucleotidyltransferase domain protein [Clostridium sp. CAG:273]